MKEQPENSRAVGIFGRTKRFLVAVIAIVLTLAISTTALAKGNGSQPPATGPDAVSGATKKNPQGNSGNGSGGNQTAKARAKIKAPNLNKIADIIAGLTDESVKTSLTALLSAYEAAWSAKQDAIAANNTAQLPSLTDAVTTAKAALDAALSAAGVSEDAIKGKPVLALDGSAQANRRPTLDTEKMLAAIAKLDDTNADKAVLTSLLTAYQQALAAKLAANTASMGEEEQSALSFALRSAEEALLLASREAGLIGGNGRGQFISGYAFGNDVLDLTSVLASISALPDTDENKTKLTALYEAYYAALQAEVAADKTTLSDAEVDALRDAAKTAQSALIDALKLAGIDAPMLRQEDAYVAPSYRDNDGDDEHEDEHEDDESESDDD